ncbi:hypothetical protein PUN28_020635 [Cardiocondyla obscurior]|uniref:Uncharacterized protein n=1 Tax=Cardiocondyla obscurior TaxID=286306 RepID=A0AAW2E4U0_9HYME
MFVLFLYFCLSLIPSFPSFLPSCSCALRSCVGGRGAARTYSEAGPTRREFKESARPGSEQKEGCDEDVTLFSSLSREVENVKGKFTHALYNVQCHDGHTIRHDMILDPSSSLPEKIRVSTDNMIERYMEDLREAPLEDLTARAFEAMNQVIKVACVSKGLKGTLIKELKTAACKTSASLAIMASKSARRPAQRSCFGRDSKP